MSDNSKNNTNFATMEEEETPCRPKPNHKRRSTFFRRRSALQAQGKDGAQNVCKEKGEIKMVDRIENLDSNDLENNENLDGSFDVRKYINDLKQEEITWKKTLLERKRKHKSILKQMSSMQRCEQDLDLSALSETERNFLLVRPNYEHICEKAKKLSITALETAILNEHVEHLQKRCISRAEKKLDDLTTRIIQLID